MKLLKAFRPIVASSKDTRVRAAFDTLYQGLRKASKKSTSGKDGYAKVISATNKLDRRCQEDDSCGSDGRDAKRKQGIPIQKQVREADEAYAAFMQKNRGMSGQILEKARNK